MFEIFCRTIRFFGMVKNFKIIKNTNIVHKIISLVYLNKCGICKIITNKDDIICIKCWKSLIFVNDACCSKCGKMFAVNTFENLTCTWCIKNKPKYSKQMILLKFNKTSKILVHHFKYYDVLHYSQYFAKLMYLKYLQNLDFDIIVPTPMHKKRRIFRQYNQIQILGQSLSILINKPLITTSLLKGINTKQQSLLSKKERMNNLQNSFYIQNKILIQNKKIVLVDDIITTGSTIKQCTKVLLENGAKEVIVLVIGYV